jgi:menaquinone-dependent protoporphyrinogen oxidase
MKTLVAYATRAGSTEGVAQAVAETLKGAGVETDLRPVSDVGDLSPYGAVVLGSAIRAGRPLSEAVRFARANRDELAKLPVALFAVCLTMAEDTEEHRAEAEGYLAPLREAVEPVAVGLFAGAMDTRKLGCVLGAVFALVFRVKGLEQKDSRDWDKIRAWALELAPKLSRSGT